MRLKLEHVIEFGIDRFRPCVDAHDAMNLLKLLRRKSFTLAQLKEIKNFGWIVEIINKNFDD